MTQADSHSTTQHDETLEQLFDDYLDKALAGEIEDPAAFCERNAIPAGSLRDRIVAFRRAVDTRSSDASRAPLPAEPGLPFERLGDFRLLRDLGSGGMGMVFLAEQESLGRTVALKVIRPEMRAAANARERFQREASALARLRHPNIVTVLAVGEDQGVDYLAMELVPGRGLNEILADVASGRQQIPLPTLVGWIADLALALQHAHDAGIVHRDVKPSNVRIMTDGRPLLLDFGLARDIAGAQVSITGGFVGSPAYAAPEQLRGDAHLADRSCDIYALGVTLYQALVGRVPFEGDTIDVVLQRILNEQPRFPPHLSPRPPRELQLVTLTALEKDTKHRYPTAAALADDLQAVIELRPVNARAPGWRRRLADFTRRHPALSGALLTGMIAVLSVVWALREQERAALEHAHTEAARILIDARGELDTLAQELTSTRELETRVLRLQRELRGRYLEPSEAQLLDVMEERITAMRRNRERAFHAMLDLVARARRLDPGVAGSEAFEADLYLLRWRTAVVEGDLAAADFYRDQVLEHDLDGRHEQELFGWMDAHIETTPPGAELRLFRRVLLSSLVEDGEPRYVNEPDVGWPDGSDPSDWGLVLRVDTPPLQRGDVIVEVAGAPVRDGVFVVSGAEDIPIGARLISIDGTAVRDPYEASLAEEGSGPHMFEFAWDHASGTVGSEPSPVGRTIRSAAHLTDLDLAIGDARALAERGDVAGRVFADGTFGELVLPRGLSLYTTAAPLYLGPPMASNDRRIDNSHYVLHVRHDGFEDLRLAWLPHDDHDIALELHAAGTSPMGFAYLARAGHDRVPGFWMMGHEVTCAEYLSFLNDPATLAEVHAAKTLIRVPRSTVTAATGGHWERGPDGRFTLPDDWHPRWPVLGVSFEDATAFADWRTRHAHAAGKRWHFALPSADQWLLASDTPHYVWGERFRAHWTKSNYARRSPHPEPVMSFPIDESSLGVFDLAGSVSEWLDESWLAGTGMRSLGGGSWAYADPAAFGVYPANGAEPDHAADTNGFRLVMTLDDKDG